MIDGFMGYSLPQTDHDMYYLIKLKYNKQPCVSTWFIGKIYHYFLDVALRPKNQKVETCDYWVL